jgi:hypothetical protein
MDAAEQWRTTRRKKYFMVFRDQGNLFALSSFARVLRVLYLRLHASP